MNKTITTITDSDRKTFDDVVKHVCGSLGVKISDVMSENQSRPVAKAKQIICFRLVKYHDIAVVSVALMLDRSHSTVSIAVKRCHNEYMKDYMQMFDSSAPEDLTPRLIPNFCD